MLNWTHRSEEDIESDVEIRDMVCEISSRSSLYLMNSFYFSSSVLKAQKGSHKNVVHLLTFVSFQTHMTFFLPRNTKEEKIIFCAYNESQQGPKQLWIVKTKKKK